MEQFETVDWVCEHCNAVYFSHSEDVEYNNAFDAEKDRALEAHIKKCYRPLNGRHGLIVKSKKLNINQKNGFLSKKAYLPFWLMKNYLTDFYWNPWVATMELSADRDIPTYEFKKVLAAMQYLRQF